MDIIVDVIFILSKTLLNRLAQIKLNATSSLVLYLLTEDSYKYVVLLLYSFTMYVYIIIELIGAKKKE